MAARPAQGASGAERAPAPRDPVGAPRLKTMHERRAVRPCGRRPTRRTTGPPAVSRPRRQLTAVVAPSASGLPAPAVVAAGSLLRSPIVPPIVRRTPKDARRRTWLMQRQRIRLRAGLGEGDVELAARPGVPGARVAARPGAGRRGRSRRRAPATFATATATATSRRRPARCRRARQWRATPRSPGRRHDPIRPAGEPIAGDIPVERARPAKIRGAPCGSAVAVGPRVRPLK